MLGTPLGGFGAPLGGVWQGFFLKKKKPAVGDLRPSSVVSDVRMTVPIIQSYTVSLAMEHLSGRTQWTDVD